MPLACGCDLASTLQRHLRQHAAAVRGAKMLLFAHWKAPRFRRRLSYRRVASAFSRARPAAAR